MEKEVKINIPDGYEIDKENSTFECIKFKPIGKELPKTWEDFCKTHPRREGEAWYESEVGINTINTSNCINSPRSITNDIDLFPNREYVEAMLALCQLIQLRDCYNNGWVPDWTNDDDKYIICAAKNALIGQINTNVSRILAFKTEGLRDQFLDNFEDLIETAKPLL